MGEEETEGEIEGGKTIAGSAIFCVGEIGGAPVPSWKNFYFLNLICNVTQILCYIYILFFFFFLPLIYSMCQSPSFAQSYMQILQVLKNRINLGIPRKRV